jgi:ribosomal protein S18 acetylase RimI-like enzyme
MTHTVVTCERRTPMKPTLNDIGIRHTLRPGDIGYIIYLHGHVYAVEYNHGIEFETYVAGGLLEFYRRYDPERDRVWICEHNRRIIGFLLLMHRENNAAQLRYFLIHPEYRGIGLGRKMMGLFMEFFHTCGYTSAYLWTTNELHAAASLYTRHGFILTEEKESTDFGKRVVEQKYELVV